MLFLRYAFLPVRPAKTTDTASVFYDPLVDKVVNHIMRKGHKLLARTLVEQVCKKMLNQCALECE